MIKLRKVHTICFCLLIVAGIPYSSYSQGTKSGNVGSSITSLPNDSTKVNALIAAGTDSLSTNIDIAIHYGEEAKKLATKIHYQKGLGYAYKLLGQFSARKGNFIDALLSKRSLPPRGLRVMLVVCTK